MKAVVELAGREVQSSIPMEEDAGRAEAVRQELDRIVKSRHFRSAGRSRQFLQFVVQQKLAGHVERLKERTIGTELFQRSPDYATGDDPVVRVQAGEVRRRLEQYYQEGPCESPVCIKLPVGSYSPTFDWIAEKPSASPEPLTLTPLAPVTSSQKSYGLSWRGMTVAAGFLILAVAVGLVFINSQRTAHKKSTVLEQFWSPVFTTPQPVLICLAKPVVYRPSERLYEQYSRKHPGTFRTEVERYNQPLPLDPDEKLSWSDMTAYPEYGVDLGDAYAGISISGLFGRLGKPRQVRIGANYSFQDLRNSPAVVVGAFNNRWTMDLTANLHFAFVEKDGKFTIQEQTPGGRNWVQYVANSASENADYAIVGRILDSRTGQFIAIVAGISGTGTQAAAEFVSQPEYIEKGLRNAPPDWQKKNLEVVLKTTITDSIAGPPQVVAAYYW
jgi:hypothetical protein